MQDTLTPEVLKVWQPAELSYTQAVARMKEFTGQRTANTPDELWLTQHPPVYTQGMSCSSSTLRPSGIPIVKTDRGGQITYHGPGQLMVYVLADLKRRKVGIKWLVSNLEQLVIDLLAAYGISANRRDGAPGVYVKGKKIAALGLRVRRGCSYHGLCLNVDMDLAPFDNIDPCGFKGLQATQLSDLGIHKPFSEVEADLLKLYVRTFSYTL